MNKQKMSSLAYELKNVAEDLLEKQKDRELVMPHMKDGKTDEIIKNSFAILTRKYNSLLKIAYETGSLLEEDSSFFTELPENSLGEVLVDAALLGRYLKDEKTIKVINHYSAGSDEECHIQTELEEIDIDEKELADEDDKLNKMEDQLKKRKVEIKYSMNNKE